MLIWLATVDSAGAKTPSVRLANPPVALAGFQAPHPGRFWAPADSGTGFVNARSNGTIGLTDEGKEFANWLAKNGEKAEFFKSRLGGWGPEPESLEEFPEAFRKLLQPNDNSNEGEVNPKEG
jgi:hypothetical protein